MKLYHHPRSPYSHKVMLACLEKQVAFTPIIFNPLDATTRAEYLTLNPLGKVPLLVLDDGWKIPESTIIVEYLDAYFSAGPRLIPADRDLARQTRFHDRIADLYLKDPLTKIFFDAQKPEGARDPEGVAAAHQRVETVFAGFDKHLAGRQWLMGDDFSLADCSLIPALMQAQRLHPFDSWRNLTAYASQAFLRPSVKRMLADLAPHLTAAAA